MIGGIITELVRLPGILWVKCIDTTYKSDSCGLYLKPITGTELIEKGDMLWWQGREAYWTPKDRSRIDVIIPRIGYSGRSKPGEVYK